MREVRIPGSVEIACEVHEANAPGPSLLLVHGLSSNLRIWDQMIPTLSETFDVVTMDSRGHGLSGDPDDSDFTLESCAADCERVIGELGMTDVTVVGHSWGAAVAVAHAVNHSPSAIVCLDGGVIDLQSLGLSWEQTYEMLLPPVLDGELEKVLARVNRAAGPWFSAGVLRRALVEVESRRPAVDSGPDALVTRRTPIPDHMLIVKDLYSRRVVEAYDNVKCPALAVLAEDRSHELRAAAANTAKRVGAEELVKAHPWVDVRWIESIHDIPLQHPVELANMIAGFVNDARIGG